MSKNLRFEDASELSAFLQRQGKSKDAADALAASAGVKGSKKRANKLGAQPIQHDGIDFASKHEGARYLLLKQLVLAKQISDLKTQVPLACEVNGVHVCTYIVDFVYRRGKVKVYEDAKGYKGGATYALFKLKKKLVEALHGIVIEEV